MSMERTNARKIAEFAILEITPRLTRILASPIPLSSQRYFLRSIRDRLHSAVSAYEPDVEGEHEDISLPLFDSLGLVTAALSREPEPVDRGKLLEAMDVLNGLLEQVTAPAAGGLVSV